MGRSARRQPFYALLSEVSSRIGSRNGLRRDVFEWFFFFFFARPIRQTNRADVWIISLSTDTPEEFIFFFTVEYLGLHGYRGTSHVRVSYRVGKTGAQDYTEASFRRYVIRQFFIFYLLRKNFFCSVNICWSMSTVRSKIAYKQKRYINDTKKKFFFFWSDFFFVKTSKPMIKTLRSKWQYSYHLLLPNIFLVIALLLRDL